MNKKYKVVLGGVAAGVVLALLAWKLGHSNIAVLNPKGLVARKERNLMIVTVLLGLLVVIPVFVMTAVISIRYREGNDKATYSPELSGNLFAELAWWGIPSAIILVLSIIAWNSSHALDPKKPLDVGGQPMNIQVIALDWKWLFIYPEQGVASINYVKLPVNRPVDFYITADAPMNSFWIPQLGGQIYAMPGMSTQLHLIADSAGQYRGSSANISGAGFSGMHFVADAESQTNFDNWVSEVKASPSKLSMNQYNKLVQPSENNPVSVYSTVTDGLYNDVILKYMGPLYASK